MRPSTIVNCWQWLRDFVYSTLQCHYHRREQHYYYDNFTVVIKKNRQIESRRALSLVSGGAQSDVMLVTSDVIIGVAGGLLMIALCVVAIVIFRSLYVARRKRSEDTHTQGARAIVRLHLPWVVISGAVVSAQYPISL